MKEANYIQQVQLLLELELEMRGTEYEELLGVYALLVLTVGKECTKENIHDAWSVWQNKKDPTHKSLKWFSDLTKELQDLDEKYRLAVVNVASIISK